MPVTLKSPIFSELEVKKSRFLTWVEPVNSQAEAKARIQSIRTQYSDARHVCFAFYVQGASGMSDDGEPSGTAGKPMFNVLNHKNLINVIAIIVRYFGGIKLGAGGLSRAYGGAVSQALSNAEYHAVERRWSVKLISPFSLESQIRRVCETHGVQLQNVEYKQHVLVELEVVESVKEAFLADLLSIAPANPEYIVTVD